MSEVQNEETEDDEIEISRRKFLKKASYTVPAIVTISLTAGSEEVFGFPPPGPISGLSAPNAP